MASGGFFEMLAAGGSPKLMGMKAALHRNPAGSDYKLELIGEYSGKSYVQHIDRQELIVMGPANMDNHILHFAAKVQHEERTLHYGLLGQAASPLSNSTSSAFAGGGGGGGGWPTLHNLPSYSPAMSGSAGAATVIPLPPLPFAGFKLGELTGVRGWRIAPDGFLRSMTADAVWAPGEPMDGKTKANEEHCGIHAYKKARDFLKSHSDLHIYGKVALWGDVIEHELGYRAEFAKILSLDGVLGQQRDKRDLARCRERYGLS